MTPAASFIEMACDQLKDKDPAKVGAELRELRATGTRPASAFTALFAQWEGRTGEFGPTPQEFGYLLGLATARALLETMPAAILNDVQI
jgi:hypothetical protein